MDILFPQDPASIFVLFVLFGTVGYWGWGLWISWERVRREKATIQKLTGPDALEELESYRKRVHSSSTAASPAVFSETLATNYEFSEESAVLRHVRSIMEAGIEGARLEVQQRISSAVNQIFQNNARLKAILSIFIVIGLLGTLYGLAEALATLSANNLLNFEPSIVQSLLGRLETALAPSIWGVFFTVVGVSIYGYYLNAVCQPVKTEIERATLEHWVPALYPTTGQRAQETLEQAQDQLRENVEAAERVAQFAERVDDDLQDFDERIQSAKDFLGEFGDSVQGLTETTEGFRSAMDDVRKFQSQLEEMYDQLDERQQSLNNLLSELRERDKGIQQKLGSLERLEEEWKNHLVETQAELQSVTETAEDAIERLQDQNEAVVQALSEPIVGELEEVAQKLANLDESMHNGLRDVQGSLNKLEDPVAGSAERIEHIAENFTDRLYNTVSGVKDEFQRQNDVHSEREEELKRLNENLETLIEEQKEIRDAIRNHSPHPNGVGIFGRVRNYFNN